MKITKIIFCITSSILLCILQSRCVCASHPTPEPWPEQFHAKLYSNLSMSTRKYLQVTDMWYDWPKGRNVYMMQHQLGDLLHEVEWNNGTSFYYTLYGGGGGGGSCRVVDFGVGITRPDFLDGADYLGTRLADGGFLCNVWEKLGFIWYYEDVLTKRPVKWDFSDGITTHVITFEVGAVLEDSLTQAPAFCFSHNHPADT